MTNQEAIEILESMEGRVYGELMALRRAEKSLENTSKLSNELTSFREGIKDENVLIGFNMAIAICNKYLGE